MEMIFYEILSYLMVPLFILVVLALISLPFLFMFYIVHKERKHLSYLEEEGEKYKSIIISTQKSIPEEYQNGTGQLICSEYALGSDKIKYIFSQYKSIFGGEIKSLTKQADRARREALLRLKKEAVRLQADCIINVRVIGINIENPNVASANEKGVGSYIMAYGTALKR
ncbi:MAG: heavy metal-binding domain-containing protein [Planctomycetes bacterium]|jgi:uncharacterized protein YbjQ (UPF0145 family)|nr:heavy metal-binding domain-containing protein [Planctomycetota bacterium]HPY74580.1 heavy metal-binding domain-containing protein [Planctomycetota bacterium]HQB00220.1 heavy metal-binding domain-containing protein [Planctomycetota bacterium]